jgi:hypothetical protein
MEDKEIPRNRWNVGEIDPALWVAQVEQRFSLA